MTNRNEEREAEVAAQLKEEHDAIQAAKANGSWTAARYATRLAGINPIQERANLISAMGVAYRWIEDADEEVAYVLEEDGPANNQFDIPLRLLGR